MSKALMSDKLVETKIGEILSYFECESIFEDVERLNSIVKSGRLEFTEDKELILQLFSKIKDGNNQEISQVTLSLITGQDMIDAPKNGKDDFEIACSYVSNSANLPLGSIFKMATKDIRNCQAVVALFL